MRKLLSVVAIQRAFFIIVLLISISGHVVFTIIQPLTMRYLFDEGLLAGNYTIFVVASGLLVLFVSTIRLVFLLQDLLTQKLKNRITQQLALKMLGHYYAMPYKHIVAHDSGYMLSRVYDEPNKIADETVDTIIQMHVYVFTCIAALLISLYLSWQLTIMLLLIIPFLYVISRYFRTKIMDKSQEEQEREATVRHIVSSSVRAYKTVNIFNLTSMVHSKVTDQLVRYINVLFARVKLTSTYRAYSTMTLSLAEVTVLIASGFAVITGSLTIGGLMGFMSAFWNVISSANNLIAVWSDVAKVSGYVERMREFEEMSEPYIPHQGNTFKLSTASLGYEQQRILTNLNLEIYPQEKCLIIGPNGCGKSTLALVLSGFLPPLNGTVRQPQIETISALLTPFHFISGTIAEHVNYHALTHDQKQQFDHLITRFGLADKVERDVLDDLSEGEKKKVQVILTILKDAEHYIFDEPLAHVDTSSKDAIIDSIFTMLQDKTVIMIMHGDEHYHTRFDRILELPHLQERAIPVTV